jgi:hypothetical protein
MRGYGLPRSKDLEYPDVMDIRYYGRASHVGKLREKCGVFKSYFRSVVRKAQARRYWKRQARRQGKQLALEQD